MGWIDKVPRAGNLYIGGLYALYQPDAVSKAGITHVLSVIDFDIFQRKEASQFLRSKNYVHLNIKIDDEPNENLIQHFREMSDFIAKGLQDGSVYVHCAMGKSRSATAVCAYLMLRHGINRKEALRQLCEGRPICQPNPGFWEQLGVWQKILRASDAEAERIYEEWLQTKFKGDYTEWERRAQSKL